MYKQTKWWLLAIIVLIFAACSKNEDSGFTPEPGDSNGSAIVAISLNNTSSTRADVQEENGTEQENKISTLDFYVFKHNGEYVQTKHFDEKQSTYRFVIVADAPDLTGMNILVAVNQPEITDIPSGPGGFVDVKGRLSQALKFTPFAMDAVGNTTTIPALFPMSGEALGQNITAPAGDNDAPVTNISIDVSRLVSKVNSPVENPSGVDVNILPSDLGSLFVEGVTKASFQLKGFVLINGLDQSDAFTTWTTEDDWTGWSSGNKNYLSSEFDGSGNYTSVYAGTSINDMFITDQTVSYVFENQPKGDADESDLYYDKKTVNSFIIKGELTSTEGANVGEKVTRYWRANLTPGEKHTVLRNTIYKLTIDGVNSIGYPTPEEAEEEVVPKEGNASVNVTINIVKWRIKSSNTIL